MFHWIRLTWCRNMHDQAMWPMHGKYICSRCLCEHAVKWEAVETLPKNLRPAGDSAGEAPAFAAQQASASQV